jgi:hypothetical protein
VDAAELESLPTTEGLTGALTSWVFWVPQALIVLLQPFRADDDLMFCLRFNGTFRIH